MGIKQQIIEVINQINNERTLSLILAFCQRLQQNLHK